MTITPRVPITKIFFSPDWRCYGYSYSFAGHQPHHVVRGCKTVEDAVEACDAHRELVWVEVGDADESEEGTVMVSRGYREGTVM